MCPVFIPFPSINQFKAVIKRARSTADWNKVPYPTIKFVGTVKIHGTNGGVVRPVGGTADDIYAMSRERLLSLESDNFGFAAFVQRNASNFDAIINRAQHIRPDAVGKFVQIYGEWCGAGIQKKVGVSNLPKTFVIFAVRISDDAESQDWFTPNEIAQLLPWSMAEDRIFTKMDFPNWTIDIDFSNPHASQNQLVDITAAVEADCPVTRTLIPKDDPEAPISRIGEGVVWEAVSTTATGPFNIDGMLMKVKGDKHTKAAHDGNSTKVLAAVDEVKVASIREFVEFALTEGRLEQGIFVMRERGLDPTDTANTGAFIKWVIGDVLKEESDALVNSGLCVKDVQGGLATTARNFYLNYEE